MAWVDDFSQLIEVDDFCSVPVVANGVSGRGVYDTMSEYVESEYSGKDDRQINDGHCIRCPAAKFGSLLYGDLIIVDGLPFKVRDNLPIAGGAWRQIFLTKLDAVTAFGRIMLEDGGFLLLEDGGFLLLEG